MGFWSLADLAERRMSNPLLNKADVPPTPEQLFVKDLADKAILAKVQTERGDAEVQENWERIAGFSVGVVSLYAQEALGYPLLVLRRQCQVNHGSRRYHILPFTLFHVIAKMQRKQGAGVFWKGWGSACIVKGVAIVTEIGICELLHVPRACDDSDKLIAGSDAKTMILHEFIKGISLFLIMPLISASLADSVQTLALGRSRTMLTFFKDAVERLAGWYVSRGHGRLLPLYALILPSMCYGVLRYSIKAFITFALLRSVKNAAQKGPQAMRIAYYAELKASLIAALLADVILFPLETVVLRLHMQGTRTIIDDTDKGFGVVPLCTNYDGFMDCLRTVFREEGVGGFYKGFGALVLQFLLQAAVIKLAKGIYFSLRLPSRKPTGS